MYADLLKQIVKYLKPKEEYYLRLEITVIEKVIWFVFYLIYEVNNEIRIRNILHISMYRIINDKYGTPEIIYPLNDIHHLDNNHQIYRIKRDTADYWYKSQIFVHINKQILELNIFYQDNHSIWSTNFFRRFATANYLTLPYNPDYCGRDDRVESYKLNVQSIKSISEGVKSFEKILNIIDINDLKKYQLNNQEKKYIIKNI